VASFRAPAAVADTPLPRGYGLTVKERVRKPHMAELLHFVCTHTTRDCQPSLAQPEHTRRGGTGMESAGRQGQRGTNRSLRQ